MIELEPAWDVEEPEEEIELDESDEDLMEMSVDEEQYLKDFGIDVSGK